MLRRLAVDGALDSCEACERLASVMVRRIREEMTVRVLHTISEVRDWRSSIEGSLGLVPTMGALHDGHLALIRRARQENNHVAVSIFVNPRQFGDCDEFARYPRTLEGDLSVLRNEAVDAVFAPPAAEMYPDGFTTHVCASVMTDRLEGASRPGHFTGVCTVVSKLFNIFQPDRACFGQKDAQQVIVIRKMAQDLNIPVEIVAVETVRDPDGVAVSSRNVFLSDTERLAAGRIPDALFAAREIYATGERSADMIRDLVRQLIDGEPTLQLEYVSLADLRNLTELETVDRPAVLSVAVTCGVTRLIDNVVLD